MNSTEILQINPCPKCGSKNIDGWSRITGYLQHIDGWNAGKIQELQDRYKYRENFKTQVNV